MKRRAKIVDIALAVTVVAVLVPPAPAHAARGYMIKNVSTGACLGVTKDISPRKMGYFLHAYNCDPFSKAFRWTRTARSQLASVGSGGKQCVSAPRRTPERSVVLVRRCGSDLERQRFTFPTVRRRLGGDWLQIKWKGRLKDTCLLAGYRNEVFGVTCEPSGTNQNWVLVS
ncbi:hypothetical protein [Nonomuraea sp. LPB2021202275-12-8]|uniref:hypothetical protein n=1 Tax=Nonomuraea sp. LPB2021202275-12-8 TaxID=3120159 RepID=UPI00300D8964